MLRYAVRVNGLCGLALTKLDVLTGFETREDLQSPTSWTASASTELPRDPETSSARKAIYETLPGWAEKLGHLRTWDDLPPNARATCAAWRSWPACR